MKMTREETLSRFGFRLDSQRSSTHICRTIMLDDLERLLDAVQDRNPDKETFRAAVCEENCLGKQTGSNRRSTFSKLVMLYGLDAALPIFRAFALFWFRDEKSRPMLALLAASTRDPMLRLATQFLLRHAEGDIVSIDELKAFLETLAPGRFSPSCIRSLAQHINGSWTRSGHLMKGKVRKIRTRAKPGPAAVAYALFLGYLTGSRGRDLFRTEWAKLLDLPEDMVFFLAENAARRGWLTINRIESYLEVLFPGLLTEEETDLLMNMPDPSAENAA